MSNFKLFLWFFNENKWKTLSVVDPQICLQKHHPMELWENSDCGSYWYVITILNYR